MRTLKFVFISSVLFLLLPSCIYHCAGFPEELKGWTPYTEGQVLRFQSDSDQIVFQIESVNITKPYVFSNSIEESCGANYEFSSTKNELPMLSGNCGFADCSFISVHFHFIFENSNVNRLFFDIFTKENMQMVVNEYNLDTLNYQLKNSIVSNVISVEMTKPNYNIDVNKIYVHNGKGLVGFIKNGREYKILE